MTQSSLPPPPPSSGGAKYAIIGILLLLLAGGLWWFTKPEQQEAPVVARPVQAPPPPSTGYVNQMEIPEERPDLGPPPPTKTITRVVRRDDWDCSGDIDRAAISQAMRDYQGQVRSCYERGLKVNNILQGTLNVTLKLDSRGQVAASQIGGSLHDRDVHACVRNVARGWRFPVPTGGNCAVIQVPFNMTPRQ